MQRWAVPQLSAPISVAANETSVLTRSGIDRDAHDAIWDMCVKSHPVCKLAAAKCTNLAVGVYNQVVGMPQSAAIAKQTLAGVSLSATLAGAVVNVSGGAGMGTLTALAASSATTGAASAAIGVGNVAFSCSQRKGMKACTDKVCHRLRTPPQDS